MFFKPEEIETLDGFQNLDNNTDWLDHEPKFEWTDEDYAEFEHDRLIAENNRLAMAGWWEMEGVRCWTWVGIIPGYDPNKNPYL
jgi:hypothetical protein